jgi:hypothetical protein
MCVFIYQPLRKHIYLGWDRCRYIGWQTYLLTLKKGFEPRVLNMYNWRYVE